MEHDALIALGLDDDGAIGRIAQSETLLDAWSVSEEPSDMIWIASRTCMKNDRVQLLGIVSMTLALNMVTDAQKNLANIERRALSCLQDPGDNIIENITVAMNAALIEGEKIGLEIVGEDHESQIVFDERQHNHMFVWQSLRAITLLYVEEREKAAMQIQIGWKLLPAEIKKNVTNYLKAGIDYAVWFADWVEETAVG